ncbi:MAG TPA: hypothetical protein VJK66_00695, partial [Gaiellaceae bacterium]|nr:hypothetical protein [Gaiellaceae bacterium]
EAHAAELAHHFAEAEAALGAAKLVHYSQIAGEAALAARAHEEALVHFERALAAKEGQPLDAETAELLFGLGRAQLGTVQRHELVRAVANMVRAFDYFVETAEVERAIAIATHPLPPSVALAQTEASAMIARALTLVSQGSHEEGRLLSTYGSFLAVDGDYQRAGDAFQRALDISRQHEDVALETRTLVNASYSDWVHFRLRELLEKGLRAIDLAAHTGDQLSGVTARAWVTRALISLGEQEDARVHAEATLAQAAKLRQAWWLGVSRGNLALLSAHQGDWTAARAMSDAGLGGAPRDPRLLALRATIEYQVGDFGQGAAHVDRLKETMPDFPAPGPSGEHAFVAAALPLVGHIAGVEEHADVARAAADRVLASSGRVPMLAALARTGLAFLAAQRGDASAAETLHAGLEPFGGGAIPFLPLSADRLLGMLAATMSRFDTAAAHFEAALEFCRRSGYRPEYAWTAFEYSDALQRRRQPGDEARAVTLREEALAIAGELGMRFLLERVLARRSILKA